MVAFSSVYAQNEFDDFYIKNNVNCKSYDPDANVTQVGDFDDKMFFINGKWSDFDLKNFKVNYVTHCPMLIDETNLILELWIRYEKKYKLTMFPSDIVFKEANKNFCINLEKKKLQHTTLALNEENNYTIYEIIEDGTRRLEFLGVKNQKIYRLALFEVDSLTRTLDSDFLVGIFNGN